MHRGDSLRGCPDKSSCGGLTRQVRCPASTAVAERTTAAGRLRHPSPCSCAASPLTDAAARVKPQNVRTEETHQCGAPIQRPHPPDPPTAT